jgi:hypothetical protein
MSLVMVTVNKYNISQHDDLVRNSPIVPGCTRACKQLRPPMSLVMVTVNKYNSSQHDDLVLYMGMQNAGCKLKQLQK